MSVTVRILGDDSDLQKTLGDSTKQLAKYGAAAAAAGAAAAIALTVQGLKAVDAQSKLARQLDTSIDGLRALQIAASDAGVSSGVMSSAMERLNARVGEAQRGTGAAADSFARLGLNAAELAGMDVDQRMAAIADAMQNSGLSTSQMADELRQLGIRQGEVVNLMLSGGDAIRGYRQEVDDLGLSMSEVDAAKVEAANDAFSRFGMLMEGVQQQLAIQVAPLITAFSEMMVQSAKDAGGLGNATASAFNTVIDGAAEGVNSIARMDRQFLRTQAALDVFALQVRNGFLEIAREIVEIPTGAVNELIGMLNKVGAGIEPLGLSQLGRNVQGLIDGTTAEISTINEKLAEQLGKPLPGDTFRRIVHDAQEAAERAAIELQSIQVPDIDEAGGIDEKMRERLSGRLERIREANMAEIELLNHKFAQENALIDEAREQQLIDDEEWNQLMRDQKARHQDDLTRIEQTAADERNRIAEAEAKHRQQVLSGAWAALTTLMNSGSRKLFEIGKAAAISQSVVATYQGMSEALKLGWPMGPIAASAIGAAGFANVAAIKSQSFGSGGGASGSNTQAVNDSATPTGGGPAGGTLTVQGLSASSFLSGDAVSQLAEELLDYQRRGGQVVFG